MSDQVQPTPQASDDEVRQFMAKHNGNIMEMAQRMANIKRVDKATADKAAQPSLGCLSEDAGKRGADLARLVANHRRPITDDEATHWCDGFDADLVSFQEFLDAGDLQDAICAAFRIARRAHYQVFGANKVDIDPAKWTPVIKKLYGRA